MSPRTVAQTRYNGARANLLLVLFFTLINVLLLVLETGSYFLFSAEIPYYITTVGMMLSYETGISLYILVATVMAVVATLPYLICWIFSKKHYGWLIAALVIFAIDTALMLYLYQIVSIIVDIIFHGWVIWCLASGIKYGRQLRTLPQDTPPVIEYSEDMPEDTPILRRAGDSEKIKVHAEANFGAHKIVYRKYGKNTEELVIDGYVYAEHVFEKRLKPYFMEATIEGQKISVGYFQTNRIAVNGQIIAQTTRWI